MTRSIKIRWICDKSACTNRHSFRYHSEWHFPAYMIFSSIFFLSISLLTHLCSIAMWIVVGGIDAAGWKLNAFLTIMATGLVSARIHVHSFLPSYVLFISITNMLLFYFFFSLRFTVQFLSHYFSGSIYPFQLNIWAVSSFDHTYAHALRSPISNRNYPQQVHCGSRFI